MSIFKQLQALVGAAPEPPRRVRAEPRLPEHLYVIPERGRGPRQLPAKQPR